MPIRPIVLQLQTEYLEAEAKARGVSRTMLALIVMQQVIERKLIADIVGTDPIIVPKPVYYRRFKPKV